MVLDRPATGRRAEQIKAFARWLGDMDRDHRYRLPTVEEWQDACSAGDPDHAENLAAVTPRVPFSDADWGRRDHWPVDHSPPNGWGLQGMAGSVSELCEDDEGHFWRCGGASLDASGGIACDSRLLIVEDIPFWTCGFRLVAEGLRREGSK
jgi:formylglycine-generating enzyme required for sulfatase activity